MCLCVWSRPASGVARCHGERVAGLGHAGGHSLWGPQTYPGTGIVVMGLLKGWLVVEMALFHAQGRARVYQLPISTKFGFFFFSIFITVFTRV